MVLGEALFSTFNTRVAAVTISKILTLLSYLRNYADVFSSKEAKKLLLYKGYNHAIKLKGGKPLYSPLYNLFTTKLAQLRSYLNDALSKG